LLSANHLPVVGVENALPNFTVAEHDGAIVGVAGLEECGAEVALLRSVAVASEWRNRALGGQLVRRVIADARARGIESLFLLTTTAERYFPNFGFVPVSRDEAPAAIRATGEFQGACPASATLMALDLHADSVV
jgi:amino-acid N-acetyltransferase